MTKFNNVFYSQPQLAKIVVLRLMEENMYRVHSLQFFYEFVTRFNELHI